MLLLYLSQRYFTQKQEQNGQKKLFSTEVKDRKTNNTYTLFRKTTWLKMRMTSISFPMFFTFCKIVLQTLTNIHFNVQGHFEELMFMFLWESLSKVFGYISAHIFQIFRTNVRFTGVFGQKTGYILQGLSSWYDPQYLTAVKTYYI